MVNSEDEEPKKVKLGSWGEENVENNSLVKFLKRSSRQYIHLQSIFPQKGNKYIYHMSNIAIFNILNISGRYTDQEFIKILLSM